MDSVATMGFWRANAQIAALIVVATTALGLAACGEAPSESATQSPHPQQAGQPVSPARMVAHINAARASAALGDSEAVAAHIKAMTTEITRSAGVPDYTRPINHESARAAVREIPGVRSSVWMYHENLVVMVDGATHRSMKMIDTVRLALEPLGDTLAVVINVQDVRATTPDGATTLSRNCQLPEGRRAFLQKNRQVDVVSKELRDAFKRQQERN